LSELLEQLKRRGCIQPRRPATQRAFKPDHGGFVVAEETDKFRGTARAVRMSGGARHPVQSAALVHGVVVHADWADSCFRIAAQYLQVLPSPHDTLELGGRSLLLPLVPAPSEPISDASERSD
tara:strand:- start:572 stop:940 length:369 start_codon:yes stop_codon:yes gene_type:complete